MFNVKAVVDVVSSKLLFCLFVFFKELYISAFLLLFSRGTYTLYKQRQSELTFQI